MMRVLEKNEKEVGRWGCERNTGCTGDKWSEINSQAWGYWEYFKARRYWNEMGREVVLGVKVGVSEAVTCPLKSQKLPSE